MEITAKCKLKIVNSANENLPIEFRKGKKKKNSSTVVSKAHHHRFFHNFFG